MESVTTKHCNNCDLTKPVSDFGKDKSARSGFTDYCKLCRNAAARARNARDPDYQRKQTERWKSYRKEYYGRPENKRRFRSKQLMRDFGITIEDYDAILTAQDGVCAVCFKPETGSRSKSLAVDHNHTTKRVRGLLCQRCNRAIGLLEDSVPLLITATAYLERHQ